VERRTETGKSERPSAARSESLDVEKRNSSWIVAKNRRNDFPASLCRSLAAKARIGTLATVARDPLGFPYTSLVALAFDATGRPLFCLSALAEHTRNLDARSDASLLVTEDGTLEAGRMTLIGRCVRLNDTEAVAARAIFLAAHPEAALYASFKEFVMYRLEPVTARWIAGTGRMSWVDAAAYLRG
jgi:putative heme iron utilization protein